MLYKTAFGLLSLVVLEFSLTYTTANGENASNNRERRYNRSPADEAYGVPYFLGKKFSSTGWKTNPDNRIKLPKSLKDQLKPMSVAEFLFPYERNLSISNNTSIKLRDLFLGNYKSDNNYSFPVFDKDFEPISHKDMIPQIFNITRRISLSKRLANPSPSKTSVPRNSNHYLKCRNGMTSQNCLFLKRRDLLPTLKDERSVRKSNNYQKSRKVRRSTSKQRMKLTTVKQISRRARRETTTIQNSYTPKSNPSNSVSKTANVMSVETESQTVPAGMELFTNDIKATECNKHGHDWILKYFHDYDQVFKEAKEDKTKAPEMD